MYDYNVPQWLLIFYAYCFLGWCFESTVVSVQQKRLVNRGFLHGPMLPIYGFGATIMLHVALPLDGHPIAIFLAGMVVATIFEYFVGWLMETIFKVKYWDYSTHRFQFRGRICLQSSLAWGALSLLLPYVLHRPVEGLLEGLAFVPLTLLVVCISAVFAADVVASTRTALDLAKLLEELETMRAEVDALRAQLEAQAAEKREELAETLADTREAVAETLAETRERLAEAAADTREAAAEARQRRRAEREHSRVQLYLAIQEAEDRINDRVRRMKTINKWTVRGNPTLRSARFDAAMEDLKRRLHRDR